MAPCHAMLLLLFHCSSEVPTESNKEALFFLGAFGVNGVADEEEGTSQSMQQHGRRDEGKVHVSSPCGLSPWKGNMVRMQLWGVVLVIISMCIAV